MVIVVLLIKFNLYVKDPNVAKYQYLIKSVITLALKT